MRESREGCTSLCTRSTIAACTSLTSQQQQVQTQAVNFSFILLTEFYYPIHPIHNHNLQHATTCLTSLSIQQMKSAPVNFTVWVTAMYSLSVINNNRISCHFILHEIHQLGHQGIGEALVFPDRSDHVVDPWDIMIIAYITLASIIYKLMVVYQFWTFRVSNILLRLRCLWTQVLGCFLNNILFTLKAMIAH